MTAQQKYDAMRAHAPSQPVPPDGKPLAGEVVWDLAQARWRRLPAVDAREGVAVGIYARKSPSGVTTANPAGKAWVRDVASAATYFVDANDAEEMIAAGLAEIVDAHEERERAEAAVAAEEAAGRDAMANVRAARGGP